MKNLTLIILVIGVFTLTSFNNKKVSTENFVQKTEYQQGWEDGHCEGWKDVKGKHAYCPYPPYAPYPKYPKSSESYRDGYNDGFKRGISDARK